ncbi:hypothetical protein AKJ09_03340 [Labilithrix luteola]|uniref:Uncharacterized protein n=2 Tax=Labilithrix luteola TaxID=1391654 RepID=A0A0K1PTH0_9BACT|nr:hypothetical protein AKJ09_03340 [Labilithrix luteola]
MRGDDTWEKKGAFCSVFEERQALKGFLDSLYLGIESYVREGLEFAFDTAAYRAAPRRDYDDAKHNTPA